MNSLLQVRNIDQFITKSNFAKEKPETYRSTVKSPARKSKAPACQSKVSINLSKPSRDHKAAKSTAQLDATNIGAWGHEAAPDADKTSGLDDLSLDCELNPEITVEAEKDESGTQEELVRQAQPMVDQPTKLLKLQPSQITYAQDAHHPLAELSQTKSTSISGSKHYTSEPSEKVPKQATK